ncbi:hypothetical protein [Amycolatopsis sp. cmx-8-4]|uniref:hypothetical protein n=1 Tax=Amycolatopsis sp. cmx-8-4 TaxID=2790947 RepID=UPI00397B6D92
MTGNVGTVVHFDGKRDKYLVRVDAVTQNNFPAAELERFSGWLSHSAHANSVAVVRSAICRMHIALTGLAGTPLSGGKRMPDQAIGRANKSQSRAALTPGRINQIAPNGRTHHRRGHITSPAYATDCHYAKRAFAPRARRLPHSNVIARQENPFS